VAVCRTVHMSCRNFVRCTSLPIRLSTLPCIRLLCTKSSTSTAEKNPPLEIIYRGAFINPLRMLIRAKVAQVTAPDLCRPG